MRSLGPRLPAMVVCAFFLAMASPGAAIPQIPSEGGEVEELDGEASVEALAGCFSVTYRYAEDGERDIFGEHFTLDNPTLQWNEVERTADDRWTIQNFLVTEDGHAMSHFFEKWIFDATTEAWTQEVWGGTPEGSTSELRYECTAPWSMNLWECDAGPAAKPIRDTNREDYDLLHRANRLLVTDEGWIHNQQNDKVTDDGEVVSHELGWVTYRRVDESRCSAAWEEGGER